MTPRLVALLAGLAALTVVVAAAPAHACRCGGPTRAGEALRDADVAFLGTVTAVRYREVNGIRIEAEADFQIERSYRGVSAPTYTATFDGTSCDLGGLEVGETWLVFLREGSGLHLRKCQGSREGRAARRWARALDRAAAERPGRRSPNARRPTP